MPSLRRIIADVDEVAKELQARGMKANEAWSAAVALVTSSYTHREQLRRVRRSQRELSDLDLEEE